MALASNPVDPRRYGAGAMACAYRVPLIGRSPCVRGWAAALVDERSLRWIPVCTGLGISEWIRRIAITVDPRVYRAGGMSRIIVTWIGVDPRVYRAGYVCAAGRHGYGGGSPCVQGWAYSVIYGQKRGVKRGGSSGSASF